MSMVDIFHRTIEDTGCLSKEYLSTNIGHMVLLLFQICSKLVHLLIMLLVEASLKLQKVGTQYLKQRILKFYIHKNKECSLN